MTRSPLPDLGHVDQRLAAMCETCLREEPETRYQSCEDLANDVDIYFGESGKVVTNEQLEEVLHDLFSPEPAFVSPRFIPLVGSDVLEQPGFDPQVAKREAESAFPSVTIKLDELD